MRFARSCRHVVVFLMGFFGDDVSLRRVKTIHLQALAPLRGIPPGEAFSPRKALASPEAFSSGLAEAISRTLVDVVVTSHDRVTSDQARPTSIMHILLYLGALPPPLPVDTPVDTLCVRAISEVLSNNIRADSLCRWM